MFRNRIVPLLILLVASANRFVTKLIPIGGVYEFILLLSVLGKHATIARLFRKNHPALLVAAYALIVLLLETLMHGFGILMLRRAMLGLYIITPVILLAYKNELGFFFNKRILYVSVFLLLISLAPLPEFQETMAAELAGALFIACSIQ